MTSSDLPEFEMRAYGQVLNFIEDVLTARDTEYFIELIAYPDRHFRVIFDPAYFVLAEGATEPSKSQWNTLKKRLKRLDPATFVFKQHGFTDEGGYLDFGFFLHQR